MDEADIATLAAARRTRSMNVTRSTCGSCVRPIYREPAFPGVIVEWRHTSTGQPLSWNPERHLASETQVRPHQHRLAPEEDVMRCTTSGCGAEMVQRSVESSPDTVNERDAKTRESRLRGQFNSRASHQNKRQPIRQER